MIRSAPWKEAGFGGLRSRSSTLLVQLTIKARSRSSERLSHLSRSLDEAGHRLEIWVESGGLEILRSGPGHRRRVWEALRVRGKPDRPLGSE